ncbi:polyphosphate:AMP phosphotransferase [Pollutimonas bauzanensis]|uniref:polyphosphate:AMP phosphotransferase n=1 Tax=Pollutimonas bauzanensis TaxID=658167 RepID=UPI003342C46E
MFDIAESDPGLSKEQAKPVTARLRTALLKAQYARLEKAERSLLIVISGIDGAGKGASVSLLNEWMDARHIRTMAFGAPTREEKGHPFFWRYWRQLPAQGRIGIVFGSWYQPLFHEAAKKKPNTDAIQAHAHAIREFETLLAQDGVQIIKLWYHLSRDAQKERVDTLLANPETAWRVGPADFKVRKKFARLRTGAGLGISLTHGDYAPWLVIPSADDEMRAIATGQAVLSALRESKRKQMANIPVIDAMPVSDASSDPGRKTAVTKTTPQLDNLDYSAALNDKEYETGLALWQSRLAELSRDKAFSKLPLVLVFEGNDAAGKGGAIRRVTHALDPRQFHAIPISAPSPEELMHPYLWRFWRDLPQPGKVTIFDRSWYGRVLVERVEKYAKPAEWERAYSEINEFEAQLRDSGALVLKFWLAITKKEQLIRFHEREASPFKSFKITPDDWRNRKKWDAYQQAANEMFVRTDTPGCPWHVLSANNKQHARVAVLECIVKALEKAL